MPRDRAHLIYGVVDLLLAGLYLVLFLRVVPARSMTITIVAVAVSAVLAAGGVGMLTFSPLGRRIAAISSVIMLVACAALIALLLLSVAYLHGIYDGIGEAGVAIGLLAAALAVEVVGLVPGLQLAYLRRRRREAP
jgi:hypothetical protein